MHHQYLELEPLTLKQEKTATADMLFRHNVRFALKEAHAAARKHRNLESFEARALYGLWDAAQRFEPVRANGGRFIAYAQWYIRREIQEETKLIRSAIHVPNYALSLAARKRRGDQLTERQNACADSIVTTEPLDNETDDSMSHAQKLRDPQNAPDLALSRQDLFQIGRGLLQALKPRDRSILMARLGFDGGEIPTLEAVGEAHGVTRERVRQIEMESLRTLRKVAKAKGLNSSLLRE